MDILYAKIEGSDSRWELDNGWLINIFLD